MFCRDINDIFDKRTSGLLARPQGGKILHDINFLVVELSATCNDRIKRSPAYFQRIIDTAILHS